MHPDMEEAMVYEEEDENIEMMKVMLRSTLPQIKPQNCCC